MLSEFKVYAVLPSADLARAKTWYEVRTGTTPVKEDPGGLWYECADGTWFVVTQSAFAGSAQNTAVSFQVRDIAAAMGGLRDRGVVFEEYDLPDFKTADGLFTMGPFKAAWFKDADGNIIELSEVSSPE
jgi:catechol 2,3-dioxygenase-like lactoylglutathione lyase family enzyme